MRAAAADGDLTHPTALLAETKPIDDLAGDERRKHRVVARRIEEADYPDHRIEQACVEPAHGHHLDRVIHPRGVEPSLDQTSVTTAGSSTKRTARYGRSFDASTMWPVTGSSAETS